MHQERNAVCARGVDTLRIFPDSLLHFFFVSEHGRRADFERRSVFKKVFGDRNIANLSGGLDRGLVVALGPSVRCVEQVRSLFKHFPYLLWVSMACDYELTD